MASGKIPQNCVQDLAKESPRQVPKPSDFPKIPVSSSVPEVSLVFSSNSNIFPSETSRNSRPRVAPIAVSESAPLSPLRSKSIVERKTFDISTEPVTYLRHDQSPDISQKFDDQNPKILEINGVRRDGCNQAKPRVNWPDIQRSCSVESSSKILKDKRDTFAGMQYQPYGLQNNFPNPSLLKPNDVKIKDTLNQVTDLCKNRGNSSGHPCNHLHLPKEFSNNNKIEQVENNAPYCGFKGPQDNILASGKKFQGSLSGKSLYDEQSFLQVQQIHPSTYSSMNTNIRNNMGSLPVSATSVPYYTNNGRDLRGNSPQFSKYGNCDNHIMQMDGEQVPCISVPQVVTKCLCKCNKQMDENSSYFTTEEGKTLFSKIESILQICEKHSTMISELKERGLSIESKLNEVLSSPLTSEREVQTMEQKPVMTRCIAVGPDDTFTAFEKTNQNVKDEVMLSRKENYKNESNQLNQKQLSTIPNVTDLNREKSLTLDGLTIGTITEQPPSPPPSVHLDIEEYQDSSGEDTDYSCKNSCSSSEEVMQCDEKEPILFYKKVTGQVEKFLQPRKKSLSKNRAFKHDRKNENSDPFDSICVATIDQIRDLGISISDKALIKCTKKSKSRDRGKKSKQKHLLTETSIKVNALALKYLKDNPNLTIKDLGGGNGNYSATDDEDENAGCKNIPKKILDISLLEKQPKLV